MKKKYKFKLDAVLKIRKLKEEQVKMEIGRLNVEINNYENMVKQHSDNISEAYQAQEAELGKGLVGLEARFHPYFVQGKRAHIEALQAEIKMLQAKREKLYHDLNTRRGEVKVIENLKEKDYQAFKKQMNKKINENLEEDVIKWSHQKRQEEMI